VVTFKEWLVGRQVSPDRVEQLRRQLGQQAQGGGPTRRAAIGGMAVAGGAAMVAGQGDGLHRPMNAPPAGVTSPGVQPGGTNVVRARYVIVSGVGDGVFVYKAGTQPKLGNPPIAWMGSGLVDPYGNILPSTTGVASTGTFTAGNTVITSTGVFTYAPSIAPGNLVESISPTGGTGPFGEFVGEGFASYSGANFMQMAGGQLTWDNGGFISENTTTMVFGGVPLDILTPLASTLDQVQPGTTATPETFHTLGTITGSNTTQFRARYMVSPDGNFCVIDIWLEAAAGGSTAGTYTFSNTLPAAYQFSGNGLRTYPLPFNAPITTATQDSVIVIDGNGTASPGRVRVTIPAVAANVWFTGTCFVPFS
jgi:hypothetical protein